MTPVADGAAAAARFPAAHHVVITNGFHVNALTHSRSECGALLVRRFLDTLSTEDDSCAAEVAPVRLVPRFARDSAELPAAQALPGNQADEALLRVVTAALQTCGDVLTRARDNGAGTGVGLRGGTVTVAAMGAGYHLRLHRVRWTSDVEVSGDITWPGRSGEVQALLDVVTPGGALGKLELQWPEGVLQSRASVRGSLGGQLVAAAAPAP
jgi:hypothetical protein